MLYFGMILLLYKYSLSFKQRISVLINVSSSGEQVLNVGRIMAMALVHSHSGFPFLAKSVYDYICDVPLSLIEISEEEIPNYEVKALLEKVYVYIKIIIIIIIVQQNSNAEEEDVLKKCCSDGTDIIIEAGYTKPLTLVTLAEKDSLIKTIKIHFTILKCKAELDQLKSGLSIMGVGEALCSHSDLLSPLFISTKATSLTHGIYATSFFF